MLQAIALTSSGPPVATRAMAIESLAVFNAVSAIEGTPGYLVNLTAPEDASPSPLPLKPHTTHWSTSSRRSRQCSMRNSCCRLVRFADGQSESDGIAVGAQAAAGHDRIARR